MLRAFRLPTGAALLVAALLACPASTLANEQKYKTAAEQAADDIATIRQSDRRAARGLDWWIKHQEAVIADTKTKREEVYKEANERRQNLDAEIAQTRDDIVRGGKDGAIDYFSGGAIGGVGALKAFDDAWGQVMDYKSLGEKENEYIDLATGKWVTDHTKQMNADLALATNRLNFLRGVAKEAAEAERKRADATTAAGQTGGELLTAMKVIVQRFVERRKEEERKRARERQTEPRFKSGGGSGTAGGGGTGGGGSGGSAGDDSLFDRNRRAIERWQKNFGH